jgi:hypothetical protein
LEKALAEHWCKRPEHYCSFSIKVVYQVYVMVWHVVAGCIRIKIAYTSWLIQRTGHMQIMPGYPMVLFRCVGLMSNCWKLGHHPLHIVQLPAACSRTRYIYSGHIVHLQWSSFASRGPKPWTEVKPQYSVSTK